MAIRFRGLFLSLVLRCSLCASGQPAVDNPDLRIGDQWFYHRTGLEAGKATDRRWWRRVVDRLPDGQIRMQRSNGEFDISDSSWNFLNPSHPEFRLRDFQFPLQVGAEWSYSSPMGSLYQHGSWKVVAYETITVPAGVFECFRLKGERVSSTRSFSDTRNLTRWYCPAVRGVAKADEEITI
jgi:hypothetical protein